MIKRIAVIQWAPEDGIANAICRDLIGLGLEPVLFQYDGTIPQDVDMVLTFAPYDRFLPAASQMEKFPPEKRPIFVHWQTQNPPDPRIPWVFMKWIAWFRSWIDRLGDSPRSVDRFIANLKPVHWLRQRMYRFRFIGDYWYAYSQGWLDLLVHSSKIYAQMCAKRGFPAVYIPWGTSPEWHADLQLERDIDVLWFGKRRIGRRSHLLDAIRDELQHHGIRMHVIDGVENPFIFGDERTQLLNRTKIVLNLQINPYDNVCTYRFQMVAGNKCLVIAEPELDHHQHVPGKHFVTAEAREIVQQILYYLSHEDERQQITEKAYQLVTQDLTMGNSLKAIVSAAEDKLAQRAYASNAAKPLGAMHLNTSH